MKNNAEVIPSELLQIIYGNYVIVNLELDSKVCELMHFYILKTGQICSGHEMVGIFF